MLPETLLCAPPTLIEICCPNLEPTSFTLQNLSVDIPFHLAQKYVQDPNRVRILVTFSVSFTEAHVFPRESISFLQKNWQILAKSNPNHVLGQLVTERIDPENGIVLSFSSDHCGRSGTVHSRLVLGTNTLSPTDVGALSVVAHPDNGQCLSLHLSGLALSLVVSQYQCIIPHSPRWSRAQRLALRATICTRYPWPGSAAFWFCFGRYCSRP